MENLSISRRTVAKGAAWAAPAVAVASVAQAARVSPGACDTFKFNWEKGIGGFSGIPFRAVPTGDAGNSATANVALGLDEGKGAVTSWTYRGGLPSSLSFDPATNLIKGTPVLADVGVHIMEFDVLLKDGTLCKRQIPVTIEEYMAQGRWTSDWGAPKQSANIIGVHWLNTTDTPICGDDFNMKIWFRAVNADLSEKTSGVTLGAIPLSSINVSNYSTTTGRWSNSSPANQYLMVRKHDKYSIACGQYFLGTGGHRPIDDWFSAGVVRYLTAYAGVECMVEKLAEFGVTRAGEGFWELKLEEGACIQPGEFIHVQIGQAGPGTVPWVGEFEVNTPVVSTRLSSLDNTYLHGDWDQPLALPYTPGVNNGINGIF
ncbi:MAG: Ig domain-containing protein [Actinomycetaceae bacterium]|nr:Ig domain-containing protein [Actinomycetaceae bacterium]